MKHLSHSTLRGTFSKRLSLLLHRAKNHRHILRIWDETVPGTPGTKKIYREGPERSASLDGTRAGFCFFFSSVSITGKPDLRTLVRADFCYKCIRLIYLLAQ